jgi:signal transduction histidine kinase
MEGCPASTGAKAEGARALGNSVVKAPDPAAWKLSFMDRLSEADRQVLLARGQRRFFPAGTVICQEGDPGDALYVVERGQVAVLKEMSDGRSTLLGYRGRGEVLGEMSLVSQQPRFASIVVEEDAELLCIPAAEFPTLMSYSGISWAILNVLNDRLLNADLARTSILQAEQKLARRVRRLTTEAERQAQLTRVREEALELITHDLRTPLTVIDGCLQMLRNELSEGAPASLIDILGLAARSVEQLSSLVDALLEAARQEESGIVVTARPVDLAVLIEGAVENVAAVAADADIRLACKVAPDLPRPLADAEKVERVVLNLLDNALSYTPSGGEVVVAAEARDALIEVSVNDTGPGVPAEYRESIFERFVRVPDTKGRRKGFGLGLYFCRQVVEAHGGDIWVEPGSGDVGSRFVFTLPLEARTDGV